MARVNVQYARAGIAGIAGPQRLGQLNTVRGSRVPITHVWKTGANGYLLDSSKFADGAAFSEGDAVVVNDGTPSAASVNGGLAYLQAGNYQFNVTGARASFGTTNIGLNKLTTLSTTGPGPLVWTGTAQVVNDGNIAVGSAAAQGRLEYYGASSSIGPTFTNNGRIALQNASLLSVGHVWPGSDGTFLNASGGLLSVASGSVFEQDPSYGTIGTYVYASTPDSAFRNEGTIVVNGTSGRRAGLSLLTKVDGAGTISVRGAPGDSQPETYASFAGPSNSKFYVSNGTLKFRSEDTWRTHEWSATGSITFLDSKGLLDINIGLEALDRIGAGSLQTPFDAVIYGFQSGNKISFKVPSYDSYYRITYDQSSNTEHPSV